jgi:tRNA-specific 2-thiouridylase
MKVFVAMSGGVDSSVAAGLLKEQGHDVVGVWMRLAPASDTGPRCCGTFEAGDDARRAAAVLGIPFYAMNYETVFGRDVVNRFVDAYAGGETPNPCVACNQYVKFEALLGDVSAKFGGAALATGHYARVRRDADGTARLVRARDPQKDQSYALYMLGQRQLRRLVLPIGELSDKVETRRIAARFGLPTATKPDSQDICFIGGDYRGFARRRAPEAFVPGPLRRSDGTRVGTHAGIGAYTVGQREGLGVATGERLYVLRIEPRDRAVVVGTRDELGSTRYRLRDLRFTGDTPPSRTFRTTVALRYRGALTSAEVHLDEDGADLLLAERAIVSPGQAAVFYGTKETLKPGSARRRPDDEVIGGGVVARDAA